MSAGRIGQIGILGLLLSTSVASAGEECPATSDDCVAEGHWNFSVALGAGVRTNPVHGSSDIPLVVVPQFSYYGKRFFIDDLDPGVSLYEGDSSTLSLIASPGYDRVFFYRSDLQNFFINGFPASAALAPGAHNVFVYRPTSEPEILPVRHPSITYLAGPEWTFKTGGVEGQLDVLHEITGHDHGTELRAALGIPLGQLGGTWKMNLGLTWKSAGIVNYYYGYPGIYDANAAVNPFVKIGFSRPLSRRWRLDAFVHLERLGNGIVNSPIIDQRYVKTGFVGATYAFHH